MLPSAVTLLFSYRQNAGELPPVCGGREAYSALEQPTKEGRIFVADVEADLIDGCAFRLNNLLGLLDAQRMHIVHRQITRCCPETTSECARLQT